MASLSNINGLFDVHSTGAIQFNGNHGAAGQILKSNGNAAPTWVAASTVIGGPYLPLTGGTLTGPLAGTSATFSGALGLSGTAAQYVTGTGALATFPAIPQGDITAVIAGTDLSGGGTSGSVTLNNTSTLATVTGRGASTGTSTTFGSTGVNTKLRVVDTTYYTSPTYSWTDSALQTTSIEIVDATTDNANVCATLVMHNYGDGGVKFRMGNTGDKTLYLSSGQSGGAGNPTDDNSGTYFDEMKINNAVVYHTGNLPSGSGVTSVATGTGLTGGTITTTGTLSIDSTVATLAGSQTFTGNKYFNNFFLEFNSKTLANFNDLNNNQFDVSMYDVYNLATASTGMLSTYGTLFQINGRTSHTKTQFAFNGGNDNLQYRTSWYPNTAWTSFRQIWDSDNLPNPTQGGPYLPLTGGTVTGSTDFTAGTYPLEVYGIGSTQSSSAVGLGIYGSSTAGAIMHFHRPGAYAVNFGLDSDNIMRIGGWSANANRWFLDMNGNNTVAGSFRAPIFYDSLNTLYYGDFGSTTMGKYFGRQAHNEGFQVGSYNNVGENSVRSNPIYTIGSNYIPASTTLSSMYGIGYTHKNASFISMVGASGWGMYVAADGNARVWLDGSSGRVSATGAMYSPIYYDTSTAYYGDFASTSRMSRINGGNGNSPAFVCVANASYGAGTELEIGGWSTGTTVSKIRTSNGNLHIDSKSGYQLYLNHYPPGNILVGNGGGYLLAYQSMRSPIFYDSNNTAYYANLASTSRLNTLNCDGAITSGTSSTGNIYCGTSTSTHFRFHVVSNSTYFDMNSGTIRWRQGSSTRFYFYPSTANMTINGTLTQNSDIRIKENVIEINDCISKVQGMRGVYYNRTDFNTEVTKVGVIAQEVEAVLPELILENEESGLKSVAYSELTAVLINAIKEQQVIIDDLKSRIEKLEL